MKHVSYSNNLTADRYRNELQEKSPGYSDRSITGIESELFEGGRSLSLDLWRWESPCKSNRIAGNDMKPMLRNELRKFQTSCYRNDCDQLVTITRKDPGIIQGLVQKVFSLVTGRGLEPRT